MAIKIKKKGSRPEGPEDEETPGLPPSGAAGSNLDGFERTSFLAAAWVEDNRGLVFGLIIVVIVGVIAGLLGMQYVRGQQVEASDRLSTGLAAYDVPVEGSPELEAIRQQDQVPMPEKIFADNQEKWQEIHQSASHTLQDFDRGPIVASARITQAAAALNLGEFEEAATLYQQVIDDSSTKKELLAFAHMGLANSLAAQGEVERAQEMWNEFAGLQPDRKGYADFEIARLIERQGDRDEARERYEEFLENHPQSEFRGEVQRRLALL